MELLKRAALLATCTDCQAENEVGAMAADAPRRSQSDGAIRLTRAEQVRLNP